MSGLVPYRLSSLLVQGYNIRTLILFIVQALCQDWFPIDYPLSCNLYTCISLVWCQVQALCQDWFPIDYPLSWYKDITSEPSFYSLAALYNGVIIGLIVAEILQYTSLNKEDKDILASSFDKHIEVGYILSLGVSEDYRRNGIASLLLDNLISHLTT
ncbi:N-alpha-acetyltransferase 60-like, partial [Diaphorina citri]|uniref:N-alpha-acetyltransferase 60 n=1 Tax=Diaphorina citri TaxID=121845 RepID=A0A3Q0JMQ7_DIACI